MKRTRNKNYSAFQNVTLLYWFFSNFSNTFPSAEKFIELRHLTGLTNEQINRWIQKRRMLYGISRNKNKPWLNNQIYLCFGENVPVYQFPELNVIRKILTIKKNIFSVRDINNALGIHVSKIIKKKFMLLSREGFGKAYLKNNDPIYFKRFVIDANDTKKMNFLKSIGFCLENRPYLKRTVKEYLDLFKETNSNEIFYTSYNEDDYDDDVQIIENVEVKRKVDFKNIETLI